MRDYLADEFNAYSLLQSREKDFALIGIGPLGSSEVILVLFQCTSVTTLLSGSASFLSQAPVVKADQFSILLTIVEEGHPTDGLALIYVPGTFSFFWMNIAASYSHLALLGAPRYSTNIRTGRKFFGIAMLLPNCNHTEHREDDRRMK
jgi:hypothetical protein